MSNKLVVVVDVETTGLIPESHDIVELGIGVFNSDLEQIAMRTWLIPPAMLSRGYVTEYEFFREFGGLCQNTFVSDMHATVPVGFSGSLTEELHHAHSLGNSPSYDEVTQEAIGFLAEHQALSLPMTGSSVGFDRAMLKQHMPWLEKQFHYRNVDVSSIKILFEMYAPDAFAARPKPAGAHRVSSDIQDTVDELKYYLESGLLAPTTGEESVLF